MSRDSKSITWLLLAAILLVCISLSTEQCVSDCTGLTGYYQDCSRCDNFTQCDNGRLYQMPCRPSTYFNPSIFVCTQTLPANCDANGNYIGPGAKPLSKPETAPVVAPPPAAAPPQPAYDPNPAVAAPAPSNPQPFADLYPQESYPSLDSIFAQSSSSLDDLFVGGNSFGTPMENVLGSQNGAGSYFDNSQYGSTDFGQSPSSAGTKSIDSILSGAANPSPSAYPPQPANPSPPSNPPSNANPPPPPYPSPTANLPQSQSSPTATGLLPHYDKCADNCVGVPNGIYADCFVCTKYVTCQNGNFGSSSCPSGYYYNYNIGLCEFDTNNICPKVSNVLPTTTKAPTADNSLLPHYDKCADNCVGVPNGIYADCFVCTKYVTCQNGNFGSFSCPSGYYYNYKIGLCEFDTNNICPKVSNVLPTTTKAPTADNSLLPHYKYCVESCVDIPNGIFADCYDCKKYVTCQNSIFGSFSCQSGYYYNYNTGQCEVDNNICVKSNSGGAPSSTNTINTGNHFLTPTAPATAQSAQSVQVFDACTTSCKDDKGAYLPDGQYAHCLFCNAIVYCVQGAPSVSACPKGTYYNRNLHVCDFDNQQCDTSAQPLQTSGVFAPQLPQASASPATASSATPSSGSNSDIPWAANADTSNCVTSCLSNGRPIRSGIYKHCTLCNAFVMCSNGYLTEHKCPEKTYFNPAISVCDHNLGQCSTDETSVAATNSAPALKVFSRCISTCRKVKGIEENGQYAICGFCNVYMVCTDGQSKTVYCRDNYQYDITTGQCLFDNRGTCKPIQSPETDIAPSNPASGGCLESCNDKTTAPPGLYLKCGTCNYILDCGANGVEAILVCPDGQVYNQATQQCETGTCQSSQSAIAPPKPVNQDQFKVYNICLDSCKGMPNVKPGRYGNCQYCNVLWECGTNGEETLLFCPDDQLYNQASGQCEKDVQGTCAPNSPEYPVFNYCITSCKGQADGKYGHCFFCNVYLECLEEKEHLEFCQEGEQYDLASGNCVKDEKHQCSPDSSKTKASSGLINDCMGPDGPLPDGFYGHSADCTVVVACYKGLMIFDFCSPGSVYNSARGNCEIKTSNNCQQEYENTGVVSITDNMARMVVSAPGAAVYPNCVDTCTYVTPNGQSVSVPDGYFGYCPDGKAFVVCQRGAASIYSCPPTYVYQATDGSCVSNPPSNSDGIPVNKIGEKVYNACVKSCFYENQLVIEGLYGKCDACNQFVHCKDNTQQTDTCPAGTLYNSATGKCDTDTSGKCYPQTSRYPTIEAFLNKPVTREEIVDHIEAITGGKVSMGQSQETDYLISFLTDMAMKLNKDDEYPVPIEAPQVNPAAPQYNPDFQARYLPAPPGYTPDSQNYLQPNNNGPQSNYNGPQPTVNGPMPGYNGPQPAVNGPMPGYNGPQPTNNGPPPGYNGPQPNHNGPPPIYTGPQPGYNVALPPPAGYQG